LAVLLLERELLGTSFLLISDAREALAVQDLHRGRRAHDGDLGPRPCAIPVASERFRVHHDVRAAERLADYDAEPGHSGRCVRMDQLRAVTDDAPPFEIGARLEPGRVDEGEQRHVERVAPLHEPRTFLRCSDVERPRPLAGLVREHSDRTSAKARQTGDEVRGVAGPQLEEAALVDHVGDDVAHVVRGSRPVGYYRRGVCAVAVDRIDRELSVRVVEMVVG
jgi:hypothetical protein